MTRKELLDFFKSQNVSQVFGRPLWRCSYEELFSFFRSFRNAPRHFSWTQINMYLRCGRQYYYRYIKGIKVPPAGAITLGQSVHEAIDFNYNMKKQTGKDEPLSVLEDVYYEQFSMRKDATDWREDEKPEEIEKEGRGLVKVFHRDLAPETFPKEVEKEFVLQFQDADFEFRGFIDLITQEEILIDHKTSGRAMSENALKQDLQLSVYALAFDMLFAHPPKEVGFDVLVRTKTPKSQRLRTIKTPEDFNFFLSHLSIIVDSIRKWVFLPAQPGSWVCSERFCGYYERCMKEMKT